ncbi:hypothetical protein [Vibrio salilacus]|nr:hypothetical protein [Vibrio salilacus]
MDISRLEVEVTKTATLLLLLFNVEQWVGNSARLSDPEPQSRVASR